MKKTTTPGKNKMDAVPTPPIAEAPPEKLEKLDQQRMDNESPAAKDAPSPGEHVSTKTSPQGWGPADKRQTPKRRKQ